MRISFFEPGFNFPLPDLSAIQLNSFSAFLKSGVNEVIEEINNVEDNTGRNWVFTFNKPRYGNPVTTVEEAMNRKLSYSAPWYISVTLFEKTSKKSKTKEIYVGEMPLMTKKGTFIINGVEKVVVNQLTRAEGVFFISNLHAATGKVTAGAKILPKNGAWMEIETSPAGVMTVRIDRKRKLPLTALLRTFGLVTNDEIREAFNDVDDEKNSYIEKTLEKDLSTNYNDAILEIYKKIRPGEPVVLDNAKPLIESMFTNTRRYSLGKIGRFKLNQKLKTTFPYDSEGYLLHKEDLIQIIKKVILLNKGEGGYDDIDHLGNRRIRSVGELLQNQVRIGFLQVERNIKERMSLQPRDVLCDPSVLISSRPISAKVHSFFASGQLSQYQDQSNPLTGLDHLRRLSVMGPGGLTRERASFSVRDAHYTHYGKICPIRTPEGPNVGLITYLALFAKVNEFGFLETPYRKVIQDKNGKMKVTGKVTYLAAYDEEDYYITDASVGLDKDGYIKDSRIPLRKKGNFFIGDANLVSYMDVGSQQIVGVAASLIPFVSNTDVIRALYGCQQSAQAVPLVIAQRPYVGTGMEGIIARNSGAIVEASEDGVIEYADAEEVVLKAKSKKTYKYKTIKFMQSNMDTCYNQSVVAETGKRVKKGDILAEGPCIENGELALGANLKVAFMVWYGYNFEDAIVISERVVKEDLLTSIHIKDHSIQVLETKLGPEEVTRDIPNAPEEALKNLDEEGIVAIGAKVKAGDILVGKIAPRGEKELSAEERLLRAIFGEKAQDVRDNSLTLPHGEWGTVIGRTILSKENGDDLPTGVIKEIKVQIAQQRKIVVGDKLTGRHGNKGVISLIAPEEDMPYLEDGTRVDIVLHPTSLIGRMNLGQLPETHLGAVAEKTNTYFEVPVFSQFDENRLRRSLLETGLPKDGKHTLFDGRTGDRFDTKVVVGNIYILKLYHLAEDKMHARSTGPYSLITQQPLGGKAQFGGQRFGEMEVWALESYSAAYTLQEMLTTKSDDMLGRTLAYRSILQGEPIPPPAIPESFKLLVRELNGLALNIQTIGEEKDEVLDIEARKEEGLKSAISYDKKEPILIKDETNVLLKKKDKKTKKIEGVKKE